MSSKSFDSIFNDVAKMYEEDIRNDVKNIVISSTGNEAAINHKDVIDAFAQYYRDRANPPKPSFVEEHIFLIVAFVLTVIFGGFGLYRSGDTDNRIATGFLDIAKICAGAVVGGASGGAATAALRRSRRRQVAEPVS